MNNSRTIDALNTLVVINNDRIEGYETAREETEQADLKTLFSQFGQTSQQCKKALIEEITHLGGIPDEGTRVTGKFFRVWMDVKAALTGNDRKAILNSCEYGEQVAFDTYKNLLQDHADELSATEETMLFEQQALLQKDHQTVKNLLEVLA